MGRAELAERTEALSAASARAEAAESASKGAEEKVEEVEAADDVEVHGDLVQQQYFNAVILQKRLAGCPGFFSSGDILVPILVSQVKPVPMISTGMPSVSARSRSPHGQVPLMYCTTAALMP